MRNCGLGTHTKRHILPLGILDSRTIITLHKDVLYLISVLSGWRAPLVKCMTIRREVVELCSNWLCNPVVILMRMSLQQYIYIQQHKKNKASQAILGEIVFFGTHC